MDLSLYYLPSAVVLGALHALEPGHAKTLTAAFLLGIKGTKKDATILGLSVATTHSLIVILLSVVAVFLGREAFTGEASHYLSLASSGVVILLGGWLLQKRLKALKRARKLTSKKSFSLTSFADHNKSAAPLRHTSFSLRVPKEHHHDHASLSDEEHAEAHAADLPGYVQKGERPTVWQIISFGAAGGLVPCPAAMSVMLLALSVDQSAKGLILVLAFGLGLSTTLVIIGLIVVSGISKLASGGRFSKYTAYAPITSACFVMASGLVAGGIALLH